MGKFAKNVDPQAVAEKQAANVIKQLQGSVLKSIGTVRNYEERLTIVAKIVNQEINTSLRNITVEQAHQYLTDRGAEVGQKTLDMERQAIQCMMQHISKKLSPNQTLTVIKSEHQQNLNSRSYTQDQIKAVVDAQTEKNALSTEIAHASGLRAHELLTLRERSDREPDPRPALDEKFQGRDGKIYTVEGKGGLVREVLIPHHLAERLENNRLDSTKEVKDRGISYTIQYDIGGGQRWSASFSSASNRSLSWSAGGHGMRHTYAQERMSELQKTMTYMKALEVVSQEMGHFRPEITQVYLR
ncbi:site-specific integrase [Photobacterium carnosum]|uniref:site-specific integrase n=1 Tax=Photobacterium carnosum TaxID=2023717 RepID=UPI001E4911A3|nr:site-specific integrase [Photobacterium carnosum]MCD9524770.1 site-specific integrase [Photobacterium carnosum]